MGIRKQVAESVMAIISLGIAIWASRIGGPMRDMPNPKPETATDA